MEKRGRHPCAHRLFEELPDLPDVGFALRAVLISQFSGSRSRSLTFKTLHRVEHASTDEKLRRGKEPLASKSIIPYSQAARERGLLPRLQKRGHIEAPNWLPCQVRQWWISAPSKARSCWTGYLFAAELIPRSVFSPYQCLGQ